MITTTVISETTTRLSTRKAAKRSQQEELRMTSLDIAELCGKPHNDILKAIRKMELAWVKINGGKFSLVEYKDSKGELRPCYSLSKTETSLPSLKMRCEPSWCCDGRSWSARDLATDSSWRCQVRRRFWRWPTI